jgi:predicted ABC-type ATPase
MERRPELTIIAGPNGAGKSRLCPLYVSTRSFDGDKLMLNLRREHPDWPDRWVSGTVVNMVNEFKAAQFKISLCYFGLLSEDESVSRVKLRAQTGGHDVTDEVIRFNFTEGLAKAKQHLHLFENLTFVDGNSDYGHIVALHIAKSRIHKLEDNPPLWFKQQFEQSFNDLNPKDL